MKGALIISNTSPLNRWHSAAWIASGIGGVLFLFKTWGQLLFVSQQAGVSLVNIGIAVLFGVLGLGAVTVPFWGRAAPQRAAIIGGIAGISAIGIDALGVAATPRVLPGLLVLIAALLCAMPAAGPGQPTQRHQWTLLGQLCVGISVLGQLGVAVLFLAAGLAAPAWAVVCLYGAWALLFAAALWLRRRVPWLVPLVPVLTYLVMYGLLLLGGQLFNWTA